MKAWKEANAELNKESERATEIVFYATIIVLNNKYGYKKLRIERFLNKAAEVFVECRTDGTKSLVQMCDEELNIEIRNDKNESYKNCPYICQEDWERKKKSIYEKLTPKQKNFYIVRVRQKMKAWMFPQMVSAVLLALHRKEKWGAERIAVFFDHLCDTRTEYADNIEKMRKIVLEETGMRYEWTAEGEFALVNDKYNLIISGGGSDE